MFVIYFIIFIVACFILGLINAFIILPIIENEKVKRNFKKIEDFILGIFLIYIFIATFIFTTEMLTKYFHFNSGIITFILVSLLFIWYYRKYQEITEKNSNNK